MYALPVLMYVVLPMQCIVGHCYTHNIQSAGGGQGGGQGGGKGGGQGAM